MILDDLDLPTGLPRVLADGRRAPTGRRAPRKLQNGVTRRKAPPLVVNRHLVSVA